MKRLLLNLIAYPCVGVVGYATASVLGWHGLIALVPVSALAGFGMGAVEELYLKSK